MPEHPAVKIARMWSSWAPEAKAELESRWPILAVTLTQLAESTMSSAEETLTELQAWLKEQLAEATKCTNNLIEKDDLRSRRNFDGWVGQATAFHRALERLGWLETKRSGNG